MYKTKFKLEPRKLFFTYTARVIEAILQTLVDIGIFIWLKEQILHISYNLSHLIDQRDKEVEKGKLSS